VTTAGLATRCLAELGPIGGAVVIDGGGRLARRLAATVPSSGAPAAAICVFLDDRAAPEERRRRLAAVRARLVPGASLLAVDHNQPRTWWRRSIGWCALALRGHGPARGRRPLAVEVQQAGFAIERLRFAAGERVQLVRARSAP
jgi:hypothetical protein